MILKDINESFSINRSKTGQPDLEPFFCLVIIGAESISTIQMAILLEENAIRGCFKHTLFDEYYFPLGNKLLYL
jgi:hypothetical protein